MMWLNGFGSAGSFMIQVLGLDMKGEHFHIECDQIHLENMSRCKSRGILVYSQWNWHIRCPPDLWGWGGITRKGIEICISDSKHGITGRHVS